MDTFPLAGHLVRRVGFGAMQLPGPGVMGPPRDHDEAVAVLRRAVDRGVNHIDTAQYYGPDVANQLIHEALHPYPEDLVLVSKVGAVRDEQGGWPPAQRPEELRRGVEDNLRTLGVERLGAVNLRLLTDEERPAGIDAVPMEDQLAEMVALREEGKIEGVGISNATLAQVEKAIALADVVCVQNPFSLLDQHDTPVLDLCAQDGIAYVPFFPLGSAFTGGPSRLAEDPAVAGVARKHGATPSQVALAWLLAQYERILLIPGTTSVAHLEENLAAGDIALDEEDLEALEAVEAVPAPHS
jgi:aryl-alcohol dehydrogenase-like predicted oxidoreductase